MNEPTVLDRDEWLDWHRDPERVSASEAPTILGQNKWCSAFTLAAQKLGKLDWPEETIAMRAGHAMEPVIAEEFERETGMVLTDPGDYAVHVHPDFPWLFCTLDRSAKFSDMSDEGVVELKNTASWQVAEEWKEGPPLPHQVQLQCQMACTGARWGALAGLALNRDFFQYPCKRDDDFINEMMGLLWKFRKLCMSGELPDPYSFPIQSTLDTVKALHQKDNGKTVALSELAYIAAGDWENVNAEIKMLEEKKDTYEAEIREFMGDNTFAEHEGVVYSLRHQTRKSFVMPATEFRVLRRLKNKEGK